MKMPTPLCHDSEVDRPDARRLAPETGAPALAGTISKALETASRRCLSARLIRGDLVVLLEKRIERDKLGFQLIDCAENIRRPDLAVLVSVQIVKAFFHGESPTGIARTAHSF